VSATPAPAVRRATVAEVPDVVATLATAFAHDPVLSFLFEDADRRPGLLATFFAARLAGGRGMDEVLTVAGTGGPVSAAVWVPPRREEDPAPDFGPVVAALSVLLGEEVAMRKFLALGPLLEAHPPAPHWYLAFVGTRPDARGVGMGSALIAAITSRCDDEGIPAYLESSDPVNVPLYESHGFRVVGEVGIPDGPTVPLMWREPGQAQ